MPKKGKRNIHQVYNNISGNPSIVVFQDFSLGQISRIEKKLFKAWKQNKKDEKIFNPEKAK